MKTESFERQPDREQGEEEKEEVHSSEIDDRDVEEVPVQEFTKEGTAEIQEDINPEKILDAAAESVQMQAYNASEYGGKRRVRKIAAAALGAIAVASAFSPAVAEARHGRRLSWEDVGKVAAVVTIGKVLGGGYYHRGRYHDPYRYESQAERDRIRTEGDVIKEGIRQKGMTDREAIKKGIVPPEYREDSYGREEKAPPSEFHKPAEEEREISVERMEEMRDLESMTRAFKAGYEDGQAECEAAKRYGGRDKVPVLTDGRWAELLAEHNKPNSPDYLRGFRKGWEEAGGKRE